MVDEEDDEEDWVRTKETKIIYLENKY